MGNKEQMCVIFLDVDGVLNIGRNGISHECIENLKAIITETKAKIVLSSTWRLQKEYTDTLNKVFEDNNIPQIYSKTGELNNETRVDEIFDWLSSYTAENNAEINKWIAIDDMDLESLGKKNTERMKNHFIKTNKRIGLTKDHIEEALKLLL